MALRHENKEGNDHSGFGGQVRCFVRSDLQHRSWALSESPKENARERLTGALGETPETKIIEATARSATIPDLGEFLDFEPHDETDLPDEPLGTEE